MSEGSGTLIRAPIFVVGMSRSGTTLISSMLSAHPEVAISGETHFLNRWMRERISAPNLSRDEFDRLWSRYTQSHQFRFLNLDPEAIAARIHAAGSYHLSVVFAALLAQHASTWRKPRVGEKTPGHDRAMKTLLEWYPDARIVYMLRDPRAVVASLIRTPWGQMASPEQHAARWRESVQCRRRVEGDQRVVTIRYEDLVADPENTLRSVCGFLDLEFSRDMIEQRTVDLLDSSGRSGWARQHFSTVLAPVSTSSVDAWRTRLTPAQIALIEHFSGDAFEAAGYESLNYPISSTTIALGWLRRAGMRIRHKILRIFDSRSLPRSDREDINPGG